MRLDLTTYKLIHTLDILDFTHTYFQDKAEELVKSQDEKDQKMARLWFVMVAEIQNEINRLYNELCDYIHEIKLQEAEEARAIKAAREG